MKFLRILGFQILLLWSRIAAFFVGSNSTPSKVSVRTWTTPTLLRVRNIDLCEALIFYGDESIFLDGDLYPGIDFLVEECVRDDTAVIGLVSASTMRERIMGNNNMEKEFPKAFQLRPITEPAPNPRDIWEAIHSVTIQPKGFGGSSGFGSKAPDPERYPLPKHTVVLCATEDQCRAAQYAGTRVLCLNDNDLADAVVDGWNGLYMDDIATPGSFWLNPPHPRDDEGNKVDPKQVMAELEKASGGESEKGVDTHLQSTQGTSDDLSDDSLAAILADIDPL